MDSTAITTGIVGLILGGGGIGALIPIFRFRTDRDTAIAVGAEAAVQSLTVALQRSDLRVANLESENANLKVVIAQLSKDVETAQGSVNTLTRDLAETKAKLDQLLKNM